MLLVALGGLLVLGGVVLIASQMLWSGRLSDPHRSRTAPGVTLEPRGRSSLFDLKSHWPSFALIGLGVILLIAAAAI
jgi:hypothetical protein